jgi:signal transduction histidine kinase
MSDTVDKLLAVSQINTNPAASNWTNFDLAAGIHDVIAEISMSAESAHLTIQPQLDSPDLQMLGDPDAIQQLLKNLLSNAVKHTRDGTVIVRATPVSSGDERCIDLSVRDTGCGIAPELCARLGEAFALNSSIVGVNYVSGSGMGLAICKTIAAAHGGGLTIKSIPGQGTEVTARLRADLPIAAAVIS